jgi:hypothetical protein
LITDRILVINVTVPCKLSNFLIPNEIKWLQDIPNLNNLSKLMIPINWRGKVIDSGFSKINFLNYTQDIIVIKTGMQLIKHLTINNNHQIKLKQLGFKIDDFNIEHLIYNWYNRLFKFEENMDKRYNKLIKQLKPSVDTKLICAQIRIGNEFGIPFMKREETKKFWNFIKNQFINKNKEYKLFITSDHSDVIDEAFRVFNKTDKLIAFKENSFHITLFDHKKKKCDQVADLLFDFNILGDHCDMGVVSHSGFGMIGILNRKNQNDLNNFYVYTNPANLKSEYWNRNNLDFVQYNNSLLYLEFN